MKNGFCGNCGKPLEEGERFCMNCGQPVEQEGGVQDREAVPHGRAENYGAGARSRAAHPGSRGRKRGGKVPALALCLAAVALVAAGGFILRSTFGSRKGGKDQAGQILAYVKDETLYHYDSRTGKTREISDQFGEGSFYSDSDVSDPLSFVYSEDGKKLLYITEVEEEWNGEYGEEAFFRGTLYVKKTDKEDDPGSLVAHDVTKVFRDGSGRTLFQNKDGDLYSYDWKHEEKEKLISSAALYIWSEDGASVCWEDQDGSLWYELAGNKDSRIEIAAEARLLTASKDLSKIYYGEDHYTPEYGGTIYMALVEQKRSGKPDVDEELVAREAVYLEPQNFGEGIYYLHIYGAEEFVQHFVQDDQQEEDQTSGSVDAQARNQMRALLSDQGYLQEYIINPVFQGRRLGDLYLYDGENAELCIECVADEGNDVGMRRFRDLSGKQLRINYLTSDPGYLSRVQETMYDTGEDHVLFADAPKRAFFQPGDENFYDPESGMLYMFAHEMMGNEGQLGKYHYEGMFYSFMDASPKEILDEDIDGLEAGMTVFDADHIWYFKNMDDNGGELFCDGKMIAEEAAMLRRLPGGSLAVIRDLDRERGTGELAILQKNGKWVSLAEDVCGFFSDSQVMREDGMYE